jgi:hypothetical protein
MTIMAVSGGLSVSTVNTAEQAAKPNIICIHAAILDELNPGPASTKERLTDLNSDPGRGGRKNAAPKAKTEKEPQ